MFHGDTRATGAEKSRAVNPAQALEYFEQFINATSLKNILGYFRTMCEILHLKPTYYPLFYPKLKAMLNSWKAKAIWKKLDSRSNHKCYGKAKIGEKTRVLIIGGGPCGLRSAIEAQLLGCKVVVVEKRDRLSRNNVLHLWPFVIEDLRALGAKKFFGKFCAGAIDHISIRQLQCILLKVALILGVEIHTEVSFENLIEPNHDEKIGWRAQLKPQNHPVSQYEFDVIIGADGKRNTLAGFKRKEFRGKLAIAITANFINKRTEAEARVEEISGVAFIFNQKFFKDLYQDTGIDLENIVYYKDDTHYFVMTAKKASLIEKGVILQDLADTERLLGADNVNREALLNYAKEAAEFSTNYQMPNLEFAVNHYGHPDVAMFDFTSMFAAENASKVLERSGYQLLMILVGDSLLEPFWPTGSGCARGFLSSLDAAWAIRSWSLAKASPLEVLAERESIYRLLAQTTPDNLNKDWKSYTLDPSTRYPNFNRSTVSPHQLVSLYDTDDIQNIEKLGRNLENVSAISRKRRRDMVDSEILIDWVKQQVKKHSDLEITDLVSIFHSGKVLCAIIHHYRPDLIDYSGLANNDPSENNQLAIDILEKDIGISPIMTGAEITGTKDNLALAAYLTQIYDVFRTEIPHVKHPKLRDIWTVSDLNSRNISQTLPLLPSQSNISRQNINLLRETSKRLSVPDSDSTIQSKINSSYMPISESLLLLYPFFPSAKPSECSLETVKRQEVKIKANNKILSLSYNNDKVIHPVVVKSVSRKIPTDAEETIINVNTYLQDTNEIILPKFSGNALTNCPTKCHVQLRSKLVKKQYLLRKRSTISFQDKVEIEEINIKSRATSFKDCLSDTLWIKILEQNQNIAGDSVKIRSFRNTVTVIAKTSYSSNLTKKREISDRYVKDKCRLSKNIQINFSSDANMCDAEEKESIGPEQVFSRVSYWIESNDFDEEDTEGTEIIDSKPEPIETNIEEGFSDITSITKCLENKNMGRTKKLVVAELSENKKEKDNFSNKLKLGTDNKMMKTLGKLTHYSPFQAEEKSEYPVPFSVITEGQESELPESKYTATSFKTLLKEPTAMITSNVTSRPSSKHKRHVEGILANKSANIERKTRKRKTLDKTGSVATIQKQFEEENHSKSENRLSKRKQQRKLHAEHFLKSMQMLAANAKSDCPFEDYSIFVYRQTARNFEDRVKDLEKKFTYIPEYDNKPPSLIRGNTDEDFAAKIKSIEQGWQGTQIPEKKPKDLLRKIGKIETSDWNIKEIEKKIKENKMGKPIVRDKEKVPKWSREQFVARQTKMEKLDRQDSSEAKYADIDKNIKYLDLKLKEGTNRDLGQNKVAILTEKLASKVPEPSEPIVPKSSDKPIILPSYSGSEFCHFCSKRVYLMERLSAEGRFFHHGCFKCQYCKAQLRLGSYAFDKDGIYGHKFFCLHHYGMQGETRSSTKVSRRPSQKGIKPPAKKILSGVSGVDLLDRVRTPERVEFSNLSRCSSDQEDSLSQMDEDEWTDRNFGASTAEVGSSDDDDSSSYSDTESDDEEAYEEALEEPATKEGTMKWAERMSKRHFSKQHKSDSDPYGSTDSSSYYENSSDDDESDTATEGEDEIRARELRLQEVRLEPPIIQADTGTDTEVKCYLESSEDLNLTYNEILKSNDPELSKKSSSNSVNTADFDSALEDYLDINSNNIIRKSDPEFKHPVIDSGEESATISKSDSNSNITVIEQDPSKIECDFDKLNDTNITSKSSIQNTTLNYSLHNKSEKNETLIASTDCISNLQNQNLVLNNEACKRSVNSSTGVNKTFFSDEFIPKFQSSEPEPLLIIKRTPSKINLPKEVGKPKVAVNTDIENAKKYFGTPQKTSLRRSSTLKSDSKPKITKQVSLCEGKRKEQLTTQNSFNFEPKDEDLKNLDDYIENLLKNEEELMKPIDPNKFRVIDQSKREEEKSKCDSIDDLLEALEMETSEDVLGQSGIKQTDEKIDKLLKWLDEVNHHEDTIESPTIFNNSIGKYENLEQILRYERHAVPVSKLAKNNIKYFDDLLSGKSFDSKYDDSKSKSSLVRSKTEINFNKPRSSVDLDAIKKVNIKKVLKKFESVDKDNDDSSSDKNSSYSNDPYERINENDKKPSLTRSKTEIHFKKPRTSVDLDAVSNVDIKRVLKKFESMDEEVVTPNDSIKRSNTFQNTKKSSNIPINSNTKTIIDINGEEKTMVPRFKNTSKVPISNQKYIVNAENIEENVFTKTKILQCTETHDEINEHKFPEIESVTSVSGLPDNNSNYFNMQVRVNYEQYQNDWEPSDTKEEKSNIELNADSNDLTAKIDDVITEKNVIENADLSIENENLGENSRHISPEIVENQTFVTDEESEIENERRLKRDLNIEKIDIENAESSNEENNFSGDATNIFPEILESQYFMTNKATKREYGQLKSSTEIVRNIGNNSHKKEMPKQYTSYNQDKIPYQQSNENDNSDARRTEIKKNIGRGNSTLISNTNLNIENHNKQNSESDSILNQFEDDLKCIIGNLEQTIVNKNEKTYIQSEFEQETEEFPENCFETNLNKIHQKKNVNGKNNNLSSEISDLSDKPVLDRKFQGELNINLKRSVSNNKEFTKVDSGPPPIPVRTKHPGKETPPPLRPQRKRSLEQRNRESVERTRYVPKEEKMKDLEKIKREIITHQLPKVQKIVVNDLNSNSDTKDKECSIQRISQNLGGGLVNNHVQAMVKEVISEDNSSDLSSEIQNSATEISTDSEFAQDDPTPTSEIPAIFLNDLYVNMSRGSSSNRPKKIQVTSGFIQKPSSGRAPKQDIELNLTPLVSPAPSLRKITPSIKPPTEAYALNRTQSTGGIATKVSLELKKRYLLGESIGSGGIQKSGSASTLDTKLKSFCSNISDCQKLLKPAPEISASMQTFCNKLDEHTSPVLSPLLADKQFSIEPKGDDEEVKIKILPPPDLINVTINEKNEEIDEQTFENENEGRPRSPLHETSLIVPDIDWKKIGQSAESISSSSSTSSSSDEQLNTPNVSHKNIPTVEIHKADEPHDEIKKSWDNHSVASDSVKSISSDKKQLNQPKTLPGLKSDIPVGTMKKKSKESGYKRISPQDDNTSGCSSPISGGEEITAAFTETELSDWARDGGVSDDLEGVAFDLNIENDMQQKIPELSVLNHVCGKTEKEITKEPLSANFDSIEFMDTCTESNSEDGNVDSIGYDLFKNEEIADDSLNLAINDIVEAKNMEIDESRIKNSGYCIVASENNNFGGEVITLKPSDIEQLKQNQNLSEREEDSLVVVETTTEENTCSDSTVKNITEIPTDTGKIYETNFQKQRLEEKLIQLKKEKEEIMLKAQVERECAKNKEEIECYNIGEIKNVEFDEHCQRLKSKVDFGNVKDSIDIRKSRRKSKDSPQKSDFIQEEKQYFGSNNSLKEITLNLTPTIKTPEQIYKREVIDKERDVNQRLVQEMVMSKMRAENKPLERRVRNRPTNNMNKLFQLSKSATTDIAKINISNLENQAASEILKQTSCNFVLKEKEPVVELNTLQKSQTSPNVPEGYIGEIVCDLHAPVAPPRTKDLKNSADKLRSDARARAKMLSNEELGLSPEDKLQKLRDKARKCERSISMENSEFQLYPMSTSTQIIPRKKVLQRPLSEYSPKFSENRKSFSPVSNKSEALKMYRSDSNLLDMKNGRGKGKEDSPKKGIKFTKIMDLFSKKSPKGLFSKISPKSKDKSTMNKDSKVKSFPENLPHRKSPEVPPPVPPLPLCYTEQLLRNSEESSGDEFKNAKRSSCETGDGPALLDDSLSSLTERHPHRRNRRSIREAQLKRHRMAQEIQRKLEETEVKTKELEEKGVLIEKTLRGEDSQGSSKQESDLLQEWFDIMRDRTELRRYEKELMIRAQELELEDRHARLQHQLRKRLNEENKTEEDKDTDYRIINEMLEIVSKRDSLTALLEEDRLRYLSEDRDFEEQMLAKDLYLTPNGKTMKNN